MKLLKDRKTLEKIAPQQIKLLTIPLIFLKKKFKFKHVCCIYPCSFLIEKRYIKFF